MNTETYLNLVAIPPTVKSTATYTRIPAVALGRPAAPFSLDMPAAAPVETNHRVSSGENLTKIVRDFLVAQGKNPSNADVYEGVNTVSRFNGLRNANLIHPGQTIDLSPLGSSVSQSASKSLPKPQDLSSLPEALIQPPTPLIESTPLEDPALKAPPIAAPSSAPTDALLGTELNQGAVPVKIAAHMVSARRPAPIAPETRSLETHGAAGGPGPAPSDAAVALQRVLNKTSNALSVLKGLVDHNHPAEHADNPWAAVLDGKARISSEYGMRKDPFNGEMAFHDGIDLAVKRGTGITALKDGVVAFSGFQGGYGNTVIVRHEDGLETVYSHTARNHVTEGQSVTAGALLADVGSTGRSTGPHLHFEVRKDGEAVNPLPYLKDSNLRLARKD